MEMSNTVNHIRTLIWALMTLAVSTLSLIGLARAQPNVAIVFDGSGSMWGTMPGSSQHKFRLVVEAMLKAAGTIPESTRLGLVSFGQRRGLQGGCQTVRTMLPLAPYDRATISDQLGKLNPQGGGPIVSGLRTAAAQLATANGAKSIILVHDGPDNCGQDICAAAREIRASQPGLRVHTLSLVAKPQHQADMRCLARLTGGQLIDIYNSKTVDSAVAGVFRTAFSVGPTRPNTNTNANQTSKPSAKPERAAPRRAQRPIPSTPGVMLSAALAEGRPPIRQPLIWSVEGPLGGQASKTTKFRDAQPSQKLAPGKYKVALHLHDRKLEQQINVPKGPRTPVNVNLNAAQLSLAAVLRPGGNYVQDATFEVRSPASKTGKLYWYGVAPRHPLILPAGDYRVVASAGHASVTNEIKLSAGQQLNHDSVLNAGNLELRLQGRNDLDFSKTVVTVETDAPKTPTGRRVVARSVQAIPTFLLPAGTYYLTARNGSITAKDQVAVAAGVIVKRTLRLPAMVLRVRTKLAEKNAFINSGAEYRIWRLSNPELQPLTSKTADARFELPRGRYRIESRVGQQNAVIVRDFEVEKTGTGELTLFHEAGTVQLGIKADPPPKSVYWEVRDQNERIVWRSLESSALVTLKSGPYLLVAEVNNQINRIPITVESGRHLNFELGRNE